MTDVFAGFRPPCWCPCPWAPAWRLHTNLYKFGENVSSHIFYEKSCCDLNLGESLCICTFFLFPDSGLNLLNGFDFLFWSILNGVTLKTSTHVWISELLRCVTWEGWVIALVFADWTLLVLEEAFISMHRSSRVIVFRFNSKTQMTGSQSIFVVYRLISTPVSLKSAPISLKNTP